MSDVQEIFNQVLQLQLPERLRLMDLLLKLDADPKEDGYDQAWEGEILRRIAEIDAGQAVLVPLEEALDQISADEP